jgi:hypothetical protein
MKTYTKQELALIVKKVINEKYSNPEFLYENLKTNINGKIRANNKQILTPEEYKVKGLKISQSIIEDLNRITVESLENKISAEVLTKSSVGIELSEYKDYLFQVAKESVKELINAKYKFLKAQIKKQNKKR